jgi:hypothetical protein
MLDEIEDEALIPDSLAQRLAPAFEQRILQLVAEGFERWQAGGFVRFDDTEVNLTARLVACMRDVRREFNLPFDPRPEQFEYTKDI